MPGISSCIFSATGQSEVSGLGTPFGRPRCDSTIDLGSRPRKARDGRAARARARRVGDDAVLDRHVEVDADEHALARDVDARRWS